MLYFCQLGQRIGIVTINPRFIPWFHHQIGKYGLKERVTAIHAMIFEPGQILEAYDSGAKEKEIKALFEKQARPLIANGVDVLNRRIPVQSERFMNARTTNRARLRMS